jgi:hypothetical protein
MPNPILGGGKGNKQLPIPPLYSPHAQNRVIVVDICAEWLGRMARWRTNRKKAHTNGPMWTNSKGFTKILSGWSCTFLDLILLMES